MVGIRHISLVSASYVLPRSPAPGTRALIAPLTEGQQVGTVKFVADGKTLAQVPLVALQAVPQAGIVGRVWDSMMLMFNKKK